MKKIMAAAGLGLLAGAVALTAPASAHHATPTVSHYVGDCGQVTWESAWGSDDHQVDNTVLVVQVGDIQHTAAIGEPLEVGPTEAETAVIRWRVWGGGERNYDSPALADLPALLAHLDAGGDVLDADAPGVAWNEITVDGCPPAEQEPPADEPPGEQEPGDQDEQEPPAEECVDVNTADAETLRLLRHVDADRAAQIIDLRPITSVDDLGRVDGLRAGGPRLAELVAGGEGHAPLCPIGSGGTGGSGDQLPVTGAPLPLLLAGGGVLAAAGAGLVLAGRRRQTPIA